MFIENYFELAKTKLGFKSNAELARHLRMRDQDIIKAKRKGFVRPDVLEQLSEITGVPMEELLLAREADKAHSDGLGDVWVRAYETVKRASAAAVIGAIVISASTWSADSYASEGYAVESTTYDLGGIKITGNIRLHSVMN